jgi:hypothetical protein
VAQKVHCAYQIFDPLFGDIPFKGQVTPTVSRKAAGRSFISVKLLRGDDINIIHHHSHRLSITLKIIIAHISPFFNTFFSFILKPADS